jgi:two-component system sensor histidine kinase AlgZ
MNNPRSIKQNTPPDTLPNFRNLGITLRILLISSGLGMLYAILLANSWTDVAQRIILTAALSTPVLLTSLLLLWAIQPWLNRLPYWRGALAVMALVAALTLLIHEYGGELYSPVARSSHYFEEAQYALLSAVICGILLLYFRLRTRILSRALHDARLQALRARIMPHFLFNTINAVLSILRSRPKEAETALENMADLFRVAMLDTDDLVPIRKEIQLSKQYIALEQLRMGERLKVVWQVENLPEDALIPPLLLQPLLENAMYHGIEPLSQGGAINIELCRSGDQLQINVENPCADNSTWQKIADTTGAYEIVKPEKEKAHSGNRIALHNIRERLALLFDAEARYKIETGKNFYRVEIVLPYVKDKSS